MPKDKTYVIPNKMKETIVENVKTLKERATGISNDLSEMIDSKNDLIKPMEGDQLEVKGINNLKGKDISTGLKFEDAMNLQMEKGANFVGQFIRGPIGKRLKEIDEANFLSENMPALDKSLDLFIDDVVSGGSFATEEAFTNRFTFHNVDGNASITDTLCNQKLSADDARSLFNQVKSFFDIDREAKKRGCGHGLAIVAVYEHRDIANEIYKKYVLKEAKRKSDKKAKSLMDKTGSESGKLVGMFASAEGATLINKEFGTRLKEGDNIIGKIDDYYLDILPEENFKKEYLDNKNMNANDVPETLMEFANRYFDTGLSIGMDTIAGEEVRTAGEGAYEVKEDLCNKHTNRYRKFEFNSVVDDANGEIKRAVLSLLGDSNFTSSLMTGAESAVQSMGIIEKGLLNKLSWDELYTMVDRYELKESIISEDEIAKDGDTLKYKYASAEAATVCKLLDKITVCAGEALIENKVFTAEEMKDIITGAESIKMMDSKELSVYSNITVEGSDIDSKAVAGGEGIITNSGVTKDEVALYKRTNKSSNMFKGLKGDTSIVLDGSRAIPIFEGETIYGAIHIDYSEYDSKELMYLRTMMGSTSIIGEGPLDDPEAKFASLTFKDTVVDLLKKNLSANFIKNNSDVLYSVWKIFEDYDNMTKVSTSGDATYLPVAKVRFIPADKLVVYKNGYGMGTSKYAKAAPYAHYYLLATECYMMHTVIDGKGTRTIQFNKGIDGNNDETLATVMSQLNQLAPTRNQFRNMMRLDMALGIRNLAWVNNGNGGKPVEITYEEPPRDYGIDLDFLDKLELKATDAIGYPSTLFATETKTGELATKLHAMDGAKVLDIVKTQKFFKLASSQLATKMLRARLGNQNIYAVYNPPIPRKLNDLNKKELLDDVINVYDTLMEKLEVNLEDEPEVLSHVRKKVFDYLLEDFTDYKEIKKIEESIRLDAILEEAKDNGTKSKKKKDDNDDDENSGW